MKSDGFADTTRLAFSGFNVLVVVYGWERKEFLWEGGEGKEMI